jgi:hypothetical protein
VRLALQALGVTVEEAAQRECGGRPLDEHDVARRGNRGADDDEAAPVLAARADRGDQPARGLVEGRALLGAYRAGARLPAGEQIGRVGARGVGGEDLVGQVLQHDRASGERGHLTDHLARRSPLHRQLGEDLVQLLRGPQLGHLVFQDLRVDGLGHVDEDRLPAEGDHREAQRLGGGEQGARETVAVAASHLDGEAGGADLHQLGHVGLEPGGLVGKRDAGGQHQLAAAQQVGHVDHLGHVHPPDPVVQPVRPGHHARLPSPYGIELQHVGERGKHGAPSNPSHCQRRQLIVYRLLGISLVTVCQGWRRRSDRL